MRSRMRAALLAAAFACAGFCAAPAAAQESLKLRSLVQRTGPFAAGGAALANGQRDYMTMINERDGGINGVLLGYEECDIGPDPERGLQCYETAGEDAVAVLSSTPAFAAGLLAAAHRTLVPLLAPGHGPSPIAEGGTFPWAFNPPVTHLDGVSILLAHLAGGDLASLGGRKIALLHSDTAYGREPIPLFERHAERHGFTFLAIAVGAAEMQNQAAQWRLIGGEDPDFVLLWGWGPMTGTALAEARRAGFATERLLGIWWSGHDGDLAALGEAGRGYRAVTWSLPGAGAPVMADMVRYVTDAGRSSARGADEIEGLFYQRGLVMAMIAVEAVRAAQEEFDIRTISAEQMRWGLENLDLDEDRLAELGMAGMIAPFRTGCADHSGQGGAWIVEWDGAQFTRVSGPLAPDRATVAALQAELARGFAEENAPWTFNEECDG